MTREDGRDTVAGRLAWPMLAVTAALQIYFGLSAVAYVVLAIPAPYSIPAGLFAVVTGAVQILSAGLVYLPVARNDLRTATLATAASLFAGWLAMLPGSVAAAALPAGNDRMTLLQLVVIPLVAAGSGYLAHANRHVVAAALMASLLTFAGVLAVLVLAIIIAVNGF